MERMRCSVTISKASRASRGEPGRAGEGERLGETVCAIKKANVGLFYGRFRGDLEVCVCRRARYRW